MRNRLARAEQVERNRELLLSAARRVFVDRGYSRATLDAIADEAGFSKGVVYSQFSSKADLFLVLLERRIEERRKIQLRVAARIAAAQDWAEFVNQAHRLSRADPAWNLLVLEFRVVAARDPELSARYAQVHQRTVEGLVAALEPLYERAGVAAPAAMETIAVSMLAFANGCILEDAAGIDVLTDEAITGMLGRLLGIPRPEPGKRRPPR